MQGRLKPGAIATAIFLVATALACGNSSSQGGAGGGSAGTTGSGGNAGTGGAGGSAAGTTGAGGSDGAGGMAGGAAGGGGRGGAGTSGRGGNAGAGGAGGGAAGTTGAGGSGGTAQPTRCYQGDGKCASSEICVHPYCGDAPPCFPLPASGVCATGQVRKICGVSVRMDGCEELCQGSCLSRPAACDPTLACSCIPQALCSMIGLCRSVSGQDVFCGI
jgi:hypothetical protein